MKKRLLSAGAVVLAASLTYSSAFTQGAPDTKKEAAQPADHATSKSDDSGKPKRDVGRRALKIDPADGKVISPYSLASRTALNRQDCKPNNLHKDGLGIHGHYRTYGQWD